MTDDPHGSPPGGRPGAPGGDDPPRYRVYRSRRKFLDRFKPERPGALAELRKRRQPDEPGAPRKRGGLSAGRVLKWLAVGVAGWILLSVVLFFVSAQIQGGISGDDEAVLSSSGSLLTGSTILVLGSDQRPAGSKEPGADTTGGRADSILLLRVGLGKVERLSILRDSFAEIPGHGAQKINAAYALGGAALTVRTVEGFLGNGLEVNHVIEVSFENFPEFIDSLGGVDIKLDRCISSDPFGGRRFKLRRGEHHLNGRQALSFARVRKNRCAPNEDDRARARRQQQVLSAIRSQLLSPSTFVRLPWVSWNAPRAVRSDMRGPGLATLFADVLTGGSGKTRVLKPSGAGPGGSLLISEEERRRAVRALLR